MLLSFLFLAAGIGLLFFGGEMLVDNAKKVAGHFGMSPMAIGLTVVAFATSAPELAAALAANLQGMPDLAVGNAVGSNIANVGLILGASALFFTLPSTGRFIQRELAFMLAITVVAYPVMLTGLIIGRVEGLFFFALLVMFLHTLLRDPGHQRDHEEEQIPDAPLWKSILGVSIGVALLVLGAQALVIGASDIARGLGIPERVIGLTLVAVGTSLPELAASLAAGRKGEVDMVMGNIVGSNIFNLLCILGLTALVRPISVAPEVIGLDYWMMFGTSALLLVFLLISRRLSRIEGLLLLAAYVGYSIYVYL
ncbi:MAG: calcium/sodium antiporter [Holophagales bacterium]|nr:calcium/sodium antiporter [Holophagales bacterium]